jgi:hypothetical protein
MLQEKIDTIYQSMFLFSLYHKNAYFAIPDSVATLGGIGSWYDGGILIGSIYFLMRISAL